MSSSESSSSRGTPWRAPTNAGRGGRGSPLAVAIGIALLALLVWAMTPSHRGFRPAPVATGPKGRGSPLAVAIGIGLLALLVWAMTPDHRGFRPAPLRPVPAGCPKNLPDFVPSDATEVPGIDLSAFSPAQRNHLLFRVNMEPCPCGCNLSIAACRFSHPACAACKEAVEKILAEEKRSQEPGVRSQK